jgi:hypothetical protein
MISSPLHAGDRVGLHEKTTGELHAGGSSAATRLTQSLISEGFATGGIDVSITDSDVELARKRRWP